MAIMERRRAFRLLYTFMALVVLALALPAVAADTEKKSEKSETSKGSSLPYANCDEGKDTCKPLKKNKNKYARCMRLACAPKEATNIPQVMPENISGIGPVEKGMDDKKRERLCEVGLRKCNSLRELGDRYWMCMDDTCTNKAERDKNPLCEKGKDQCVKALDDYRHCVKLMCKSANINCVEGVEACGMPLAKYWDCVSGVCLGSVDKYKDPQVLNQKTYATVPDRDGNPRRVYNYDDPNIPLLGVPEKFAYAPPGISEKNWRSMEVPEKVAVTHDILAKVECRNRSYTITCTGDHIGTCFCGDGSRPVPKEEIARRGAMAVFGGPDQPKPSAP